MSSEEISETTEEAATDEATNKSLGRSKIMAPTDGGKRPLSRGTDFAAKPGFRNPSNVRSKASKKKRRRK